jgi:hypothetical protein
LTDISGAVFLVSNSNTSIVQGISAGSNPSLNPKSLNTINEAFESRTVKSTVKADKESNLDDSSDLLALSSTGVTEELILGPQTLNFPNLSDDRLNQYRGAWELPPSRYMGRATQHTAGALTDMATTTNKPRSDCHCESLTAFLYGFCLIICLDRSDLNNYLQATHRTQHALRWEVVKLNGYRLWEALAFSSSILLLLTLAKNLLFIIL